MKSALFSTGSESLEVGSIYFKSIRSFANSGIPKKEIKPDKTVYVAKATMDRIKKIVV